MRSLAGQASRGQEDRLWFCDGEPTELQALIDRSRWRACDSRARKNAVWKLYKFRLRDTALTPTEKLVLWAICDTFNTKEGCSRLTQTGIADVVGVHRSAAHRAFKHLLNKNIIWVFASGMTARDPATWQEFMANNVGKPEHKNKARFVTLVGLNQCLDRVDEHG